MTSPRHRAGRGNRRPVLHLLACAAALLVGAVASRYPRPWLFAAGAVEAEARNARRGLWAGRFEPPASDTQVD